MLGISSNRCMSFGCVYMLCCIQECGNRSLGKQAIIVQFLDLLLNLHHLVMYKVSMNISASKGTTGLPTLVCPSPYSATISPSLLGGLRLISSTISRRSFNNASIALTESSCKEQKDTFSWCLAGCHNFAYCHSQMQGRGVRKCVQMPTSLAHHVSDDIYVQRL